MPVVLMSPKSHVRGAGPSWGDLDEWGFNSQARFLSYVHCQASQQLEHLHQDLHRPLWNRAGQATSRPKPPGRAACKSDDRGVPGSPNIPPVSAHRGGTLLSLLTSFHYFCALTVNPPPPLLLRSCSGVCTQHLFIACFCHCGASPTHRASCSDKR